jgi:hypothetical protein
MAEQLIRNQQVVGSNPIVGSSKKESFAGSSDGSKISRGTEPRRKNLKVVILL